MDARHTVLFLGAGASKHFGYPLTNEILQHVVRQLEDGSLFGSEGESARDRLRRGLESVFPGIRLRSDDPSLPTITEVLSLLDEWLRSIAMPFPGCTLDELRRLRHLLEWAVCRVLEPAPAEGQETAQRQRDQRALLKYIYQLGTMEGGRCTIVSTNYDLSVERALFPRLGWKRIAERVDFGFPWRDPGSGGVCQAPENSPFAVLKLHGSLNWLRCALCDHIYVNVFGEIADLSESDKHDVNTCHCGITSWSG